MTRPKISSSLAVTAGVIVRNTPGIAGPLLIAVGAWMIRPFLGVIVLGAVLWALDRRIP